MDGRPGRKPRSLTRQLTWSIIGIIVLFALLGSVLSFVGGYREASRLQDHHLHDIGVLVNSGKLVLEAPTAMWPDEHDAGMSLIISRLSPGAAGTRTDPALIRPLPCASSSSMPCPIMALTSAACGVGTFMP